MKSTRLIKRTRNAIVLLSMNEREACVVREALAMLGCDIADAPGTDAAARLAGFNQAVMESAGFAAGEFTPLAPNWLASPKAGQFTERAVSSLEVEIDDSWLFVLSDPLLPRILPLWQAALATATIRPAYVLAAGAPLSIVQTTESGTATTRENLLWLRTSLAAEQLTRGLPRVTVAVAELIGNHHAELARMGEALDIVWPRAPERITRARMRDLAAQAGVVLPAEIDEDAIEALPDWIRAVAAIFERWALTGESHDDYIVLDAIREAYDEAAPMFIEAVSFAPTPPPVDEQQAAEIAETLSRLPKLQVEIVQVQARLREAESAAAAARQEQVRNDTLMQQRQGELQERVNQLESTLARRTTELAEMTALAARERDAIDNMARQHAAEQTQAARALDRLPKLEVEIVQVQARLREAEIAFKAARQEQDRGEVFAEEQRRNLQDRINYLESALAQRAAELDDMAEVAAREHDALETMTRQHELERNEVVRTRDALAAELDAQRVRLAGVEAQVADRDRRLADLDRQLSDRDRQLSERYGEIVTLTRMFADARSLGERSTASIEWTTKVMRYLTQTPRGAVAQWLSWLTPPQVRRKKLLARLRREGLFDETAYLDANPDVARAGVDPFRHYVEHGLGEGRQRHP